MSVSVYPRLGEWLRAQNLTVAELERRIEQRFGLSVDPKTLYRLTAPEAVQRADLEVAGAAAAVLGVGLADLFTVQAVPVDQADVEDLPASPEISRRIASLFAQQARGELSRQEQAELERLVTGYGRQLHERRVRQVAHARGISMDQAAEQVEHALADAGDGMMSAFHGQHQREGNIDR